MWIDQEIVLLFDDWIVKICLKSIRDIYMYILLVYVFESINCRVLYYNYICFFLLIENLYYIFNLVLLYLFIGMCNIGKYLNILR